MRTIGELKRNTLDLPRVICIGGSTITLLQGCKLPMPVGRGDDAELAGCMAWVMPAGAGGAAAAGLVGLFTDAGLAAANMTDPEG